MRAMGIHQIQLRFDATADRLLLQLRSSEAEIYAAWLTRRMVALVLPPFRQAVLQREVRTITPNALPVPEARLMLEQAALQRALPGTQFNQPFVADESSRHPLGTEPLLPDAADLKPGPGGGLHLVLRETRGRHLDIGLTPELAVAMLRLLDNALAAADWQLTAGEAPAPPAAEPASEPAGARYEQLLS